MGKLEKIIDGITYELYGYCQDNDVAITVCNSVKINGGSPIKVGNYVYVQKGWIKHQK
jgi:hypothetical protein